MTYDPNDPKRTNPVQNDPAAPKETYVEPVERRSSPLPLIIGVLLALALAYFVMQRFMTDDTVAVEGDTTTVTTTEDAPADVPAAEVTGETAATEAEAAAENAAAEAEAAAESAADATEAAVGDAVTTTEGVAEEAATATENAADSAASEAEAAADSAATAAENAADAVGEAMENAGSAASQAATDAVDAAGQAVENAADALDDAITVDETPAAPATEGTTPPATTEPAPSN